MSNYLFGAGVLEMKLSAKDIDCAGVNVYRKIFEKLMNFSVIGWVASVILKSDSLLKL